jgi:hypothetical protein
METVTITYTVAGYSYVRQVLGARPYDEVVSLIGSMEQQKANAAAPVPKADAAAPAPAAAPPVRRRGRPPSTKALSSKPNGAGGAIEPARSA